MAADATSTEAAPTLDPNQILIAEFQYIAQTAFQANEDRARVSSYYYLTAGAAVAAIIGAKMEGAVPPEVYWGFSLLFGVLSGIGLLTLVQLARLRSAWAESARAMNRIKDYYRANCPQARLETAFLWTTQTIPAPNKRSSVAFLLALSVALIDMATAAAMVVYVGYALHNGQGGLGTMAVAVAVALAFAVVQYRAYMSACRPCQSAGASDAILPGQRTARNGA